MSRLAEHSEDTRNALVSVARELFSTKSYGETATDEIVKRARVSRGAMYHHFPSKEALFEVVFEDVERDFIGRLSEAGAPGADVWEMVINGCQAFLDVCLEPEVMQIVLVDGPAVLGWERWREIEARYGFGLLIRFLKAAMKRGLTPQQPVEPLAHLLAGALNEAALAIAHADDPVTARAEVGAAVGFLLERLGPDRSQARGPVTSASGA